MKKIDLDYHMIKILRSGGHTWKTISDVLEVSIPTLIRFSREHELKLDKPYQLEKKMCDMCRRYFEKKELKANPHGEFCSKCYGYTRSKEVKYGSPTLCDSDCEV